MMMLLSIAVALLPSVLFIIMMRWWDRREPEPRQVILYLFLLGIVSAAVIFIVRALFETILVSLRFLPPSAVLLHETPTITDALVWSLLIALVAEGIKFGIGYWATYRLRAFTQAVDGIVYLTAIAWGAVLVENIITVLQNSAETVVFQLIFGTLVVGISSGFAGLALGRFLISRRDHEQKNHDVRVLITGLSAAIGIHMLFRFFVYMQNERIAGLIVIIGAMYLFSRFLIARYVKQVTT